MSATQLAIVIHAEEEFDWDGGFFRSKVKVSHADNLIHVMDRIIELGGKITLAMDYPFITSDDGKKVVDYYRHQHGVNVEFATHLHPWVNPPFENEHDSVDNHLSYPGNLSYEYEFEKIKVLTETIERISGFRPKTYLAGRYGIGANTQNILKSLGYKVDLSISAYCDFRHQQGPDFSHYSNQKFVDREITYLPHTNSILSVIPPIRNYLNRHPEKFTWIQNDKWRHLVGKIMRVKRYRLSPEGFSAHQMKQVTQAQLQVGQRDFIMSFHSPSTSPNLTPYVKNEQQLELFKNTISDYLQWFINVNNGHCVITSDIVEGKK